MEYIYKLCSDSSSNVYVTGFWAKPVTEYLVEYVMTAFDIIFPGFEMTDYDLARVLVDVYGFYFYNDDINSVDVIELDMDDIWEKFAGHANMVIMHMDLFKREDLLHEFYKCMIRILSDFL